MKKISLYISVALVAFVGLISCQGRVFDPEEDLQDLSSEWAHEYVDLVLDQKILPEDSAYYKKWSVTTAYISDTLYKEIRNKYGSDPYRLDSVDVTSTFIQIHDSLIVKVDGYRFSEKYWAHLFTVGDGILEYELIYKPGDEVGLPTDDSKRPGFYIAAAENEDKLRSLTDTVSSTVYLEYE